MYAEFYLKHLEKAKIRNDEVVGLCPFHDDNNPSFNARIDNGVAKCFGCDWKGNVISFAKRLGIPLTEVPGYKKNYQQKRKTVAEYNYNDEKGNLLYQVVRLEPKDFRARRPDGNGGWVWNLNGTRRILYRLPLLLNAIQVLLVEGEKSVDALIDGGFVATCNPGGAGKWRPEYNPLLKDKNVVLLPDNDQIGREHMGQVATSLYGIARSIKIIEFPNLEPKEDVYDYLKSHTPEELQKIIDTAEPILKIAENIKFFDLHRTDSGNAEAIVRTFGDRLRFDHKTGCWYIWQGHTWNIDDDGAIERFALKTSRERLKKSANIDSEDLRKQEAKWALHSESHYRIEAAIKLTSKLNPITTTVNKFNTNPWLLGCENGVIDLQSGKFAPGQPEEMISLSTKIWYDPQAKASRWQQFLLEIFLEDEQLIDYISRCVGYSLTGLTDEQIIFLLFGIGANGKSVFLNVVRALMGEYAANTSFQTFLASKYDGSKIPNDVAALVHKRLVTSSEIKESARLNEERIKSMTGGDPINARFLHQNWFTYVPNYKIWLSVNHKPKVSDTTYSFWRRIRLIPFEVIFDKINADQKLTEKLMKELPGILNWAIEGCLRWQKIGLEPPEKVLHATQQYQSEMNIVKQFLDENTILKEGGSIAFSLLYENYCKWCEELNEKPMSSNMFGRKMTELGFQKDRIGTDRQVCYLGTSLIEKNRKEIGNK